MGGSFSGPLTLKRRSYTHPSRTPSGPHLTDLGRWHNSHLPHPANCLGIVNVHLHLLVHRGAASLLLPWSLHTTTYPSLAPCSLLPSTTTNVAHSCGEPESSATSAFPIGAGRLTSWSPTAATRRPTFLPQPSPGPRLSGGPRPPRTPPRMSNSPWRP